MPQKYIELKKPAVLWCVKSVYFLAAMILLRDVLRFMEERDGEDRLIPFILEVVKYNRKTKEGGELRTYEATMAANEGSAFDRIAERSASAGKQPAKIKKDPNHFKNATRNIRLVATGELRKINIRLITMFNNQPVFY